MKKILSFIQYPLVATMLFIAVLLLIISLWFIHCGYADKPAVTHDNWVYLVDTSKTISK